MLEKIKKMLKQPPYSVPKGMRDILDGEFYAYQGLFEKAQEVAIYYGFDPISLPTLEHAEVFTTSAGAGTDIVEKEMYTLRTKGGDHLALRPEGTAGAVRAYIEHGMQSLPQPVMLYYAGSFFRHDSPQRGRYRELHQFGLEMIGNGKSVCDALIIRTMTTILEEAGFKQLSVSINSIGDKECRPRYVKELTNYYKKHLHDLCPQCQARIKENPLRLLDCKNEKCLPFKEGAPDAVAYLCGPCKSHFKEVLEYLEEMGVPYAIDKTLVRGFDYYTRTVFEIMEPTPEEGKAPLAIAGGGRFDYLAKALGSKKDVPAVGGSIGLDRVIMSPDYKRLNPRILKKPKVCFIQFGFEAKLKSLRIIEILRKARIPIAQSLSKDTLAAQLGAAENMGVPYAIIFGQKEAMDGTVIVRNMENRSQDTIEIDKLSEYVKDLK